MQQTLLAVSTTFKRRMPNGMHYNFMYLVLETLRGYAAREAVYTQAVASLEQALRGEGEAIGLRHGSAYTAELKKAMTACNGLYVHLRQLVRGFAGLPHRREYEAAVQLRALMDRYPFNIKWKYGQKMGCMSVLLSQLQMPAVQPLLEAVGVADVVDELAAQFDRAHQLFLDRTEEYAAREPAALQKARALTDAAYDDCAQVAQALYRVTADGALRRVLAAWNAEIERTRLELTGHRGARAAAFAGGEGAEEEGRSSDTESGRGETASQSGRTETDGAAFAGATDPAETAQRAAAEAQTEGAEADAPPLPRQAGPSGEADAPLPHP